MNKHKIRDSRKAKVSILLVIIPFFLLPIFGFSTTYYVRNGGNDNNSGLSNAEAWATLGKVMATLQGNQSGNKVLLKRGSVWREQYTLTGYGTAGNPFTIGAYGTGDDPKIMGSKKITGWTRHSGNVWRAALNSHPGGGDNNGPVFFINRNGDGKTHWGKEDTTPDAEYDWYWSSNYLYCYSPADPDTRYEAVEAAMRHHGILHDWNSNYIYVKELEICYTSRPGYSGDYGDGCTIDRCHIHHNGPYSGSTTWAGDNIFWCGSGWTIKNNICHDAYAHNIQHMVSDDTSTGDIIEHNICYNAAHAQVDVKHTGPSGYNANQIIRYNLIYTDSNFPWRSINTVASISCRADMGYYLDNTQIYGNIIVNYWTWGIFLESGVDGASVYNNTMYGRNTLSTSSANYPGAIFLTGWNGNPPRNVTIKNNVIAGDFQSGGSYTDAGIVIGYWNGGGRSMIDDCDHNCFYVTNGHFILDDAGNSDTAYDTGDWASWKSASSFDTHSVWNQNPDFVNPGSLSDTGYQIQTSSPCIDAGADVGLTQDYFGVSVPQGADPDIGASEYDGGGPAPLTASANASPTSGQAPLTVDFTGSANGGTPPYSYSWNFGDGGSSTAQNPTHTYTSSNIYTATLTVTDNNSDNDSDSETITVESVDSAILSISAETGAPASGQGGTTNPSPGIYSYDIGSTVSISSNPNTNYRFSIWTGDVPSSSIFSPSTQLTMDNDKTVSATFCSKCGDVNGDLQVSPGDAQAAFDIFLGIKTSPTWCELENADVNSSGTQQAPEITPGDAQMIFETYIGSSILSSDCSGISRTASLATQTMDFHDVSLAINDVAISTGQDVFIPVIVESSSEIMAFGFDLVFPSDNLTYLGLEKTDLTENFVQLAANVLPLQKINREGSEFDPKENLDSRWPIHASKNVTFQATEESDIEAVSFSTLRVGGFKAEATHNPSSGILVVLVFRETGELNDSISFSVTATYDDIQNATIERGMLDRRNNLQFTDDKTTGKIIKIKR